MAMVIEHAKQIIMQEVRKEVAAMMDEKELEAQAWRSARKIYHEKPDGTVQEVVYWLYREIRDAQKYVCQQSCAKCLRDAATNSALTTKNVKPLAIGLGS